MVAEALARQVPVVATRITGTCDMMTGSFATKCLKGATSMPLSHFSARCLKIDSRARMGPGRGGHGSSAFQSRYDAHRTSQRLCVCTTTRICPRGACLGGPMTSTKTLSIFISHPSHFLTDCEPHGDGLLALQISCASPSAAISFMSPCRL